MSISDIPKVWLLGDSIRRNYQPFVTLMLQGKAEVVGPVENCQYSLYTLSSLDRWIDELGQPEIIHWNNGFHDVGHNPWRYPVQIPIDMYRANLGYILQRLTALTPHVIWATITPAHPDRPFRNDQWSWRNEEIDEYNRAATELMLQNNIPVNDLHKTVWDNLDQYLCEDQVHLSESGQKACAQAVVQAIRPYLQKG